MGTEKHYKSGVFQCQYEIDYQFHKIFTGIAVGRIDPSALPIGFWGEKVDEKAENRQKSTFSICF
jgi:hypothetical protein